MGFKIGGDSTVNLYDDSTMAAQLPAQLDAKVSQSVKPPQTQTRFDVPKEITLTAEKGETAEKLQLRVLREAVNQAGFGGTVQAKEFITKYADSYKVGKEGEKFEAGKRVIVNLSKEQIADLRALQKDYVANGGQLRKVAGGEWEKTVISNRDAGLVRSGIDRSRAENRRLNDLIDDAQIIPKVFGTPSKLRDLKHVTLDVDKNVTATDKDKILLGYIESRYGAARGGTLWGDSTGELLAIAKTRGVSIENVTVENGKADFDVSVESLLKLHHAFIGVNEKANVEKALYEKTYKDTVAERFAKGLFEGAWGDLKSNWKMVTDPIGTLDAITRAIPPLANIGLKIAMMPELERAKLFASLAEAGAGGLSEMPLSEASERAGQFVGAMAVELALGVGVAKGIGALSKTAVGKLIGVEVVALGKDIKLTIGKIPIPTSVEMVELAVEGGQKIRFTKFETKNLSQIVQEMRSTATTSGGAKAITADTLEHIFHGEINVKGKATGFHSDIGEMQAVNQTKIVEGTRSLPDKNGVYKAKVEVKGVAKTANSGESTFFPDSWSKADVVNTVNEAYVNKKIPNPKIPNYFEGRSSSGVLVGGYMKTDGTIATAFPLYGK